MNHPGNNVEQCRDLVAGLADAGVVSAFISPGSRNTPLTLAFAASDRIQDTSIRDERSAGFIALGAAKATGVPAVVVCTSGSATAHYLPAIVEADQASTPMVVLTADRPVELRGTFAPQTMDQTHLYGSHVKASVELESPTENWRASARAIVETARNGIAGVVHVNIPLSEPLLPASYPPTDSVAAEGDQPSDANHRADIPNLAEELENNRVLIIAGGSCGPSFPRLLGTYAESLASPVIGDPQCAPDHPTTIRSADMLARTGHLEELQPDVVLRLGGLPTSKSVWNWLETCGIPQILVGRSRLADPLSSANLQLEIAPVAFVGQLPGFVADAGYLTEWQQADRFMTNAIEDALSSAIPTEPWVARTVTEYAPSDSAVFVGSSMPIRDVDTYGTVRSDVRVIANRGLNGIDGSLSTALGMAMSGIPTTALVGDVAALHDATALSEIARLGAPLRVVVINNDGGGIFSFLPQGRSSVVSDDVYERHWGTPHGLSLATISHAMGLDARLVDSVDDLVEAVRSPVRPELIEVVTDRRDNVEVHHSIRAAIREALAAR